MVFDRIHLFHLLSRNGKYIISASFFAEGAKLIGLIEKFLLNSFMDQFHAIEDFIIL